MSLLADIKYTPANIPSQHETPKGAKGQNHYPGELTNNCIH